MSESEPFPPPPSAPPSEPIALRPVKLKSSWPTLIGVVSIVLGALGIFNGLMSTMAPLFMRMFEGVTAAAKVDPMAGMKHWAGWMVASGLVSMAVAALLLVAGVGLTMRRPWSVKLHLTWAVLKLVAGPAAVLLGALVQMDQMRSMEQQMAQQGSATPASMTAIMGPMTIVMTGLMLLWAVALPLVSLGWFLSPRARREVREWTPNPGRSTPPAA